jgi:hypothetical protein
MLDIRAIPTFLEAMALIGFTLPAAAAALRAAIAADTRDQGKAYDLENQSQAPNHLSRPIAETSAYGPGPETQHETPASVSPVSPPCARKLSTPRVQAFRARERLKRDGVSPPVSPPLLKVINLNQEEDPKESAAKRDETPAAIPLPPDWQPAKGRRARAVERLGEVRALALIGEYRAFFHGRPQETRTPRGWQERFDNWVTREERARGAPQLPLVRVFDGPARPPPGVYIRRDTPQWEAWKRERGGSMPADRAGGWWCPSEWPPAYRETG